MEIYVYILSGVLVLFGCLVYVIKNLYSKNKIYEQWILETQASTEKLYSDMQEIDSRQMFEKDDEVGTLYASINELINDFRQKVNNEE